jgi:cell wall-associated NlpC family hydrolase
MTNVFEGGYSRTTGLVRVREVSAALVRKLGKGSVAQGLETVTSPDGWHPTLQKWFGTEIVAREMGLRYNRLEAEDAYETSATEPMNQADAVYAIWKAKTAPSTWGADALTSFELSSYSETRRQVVEFALSLVGTPYVWGGEWTTSTPSGYPYGAQAHGGLDCSGFAWYVLKESTSSWSPQGRNYPGWSFPERSSSDMARAAEKKLSFQDLKPADVVFFASNGKDARSRDVYHAGIYLGEGWMVHSSGSRAGISLAEIGPGSWWNDQLAWGRRIITN